MKPSAIFNKPGSKALPGINFCAEITAPGGYSLLIWIDLVFKSVNLLVNLICSSKSSFCLFSLSCCSLLLAWSCNSFLFKFSCSISSLVFGLNKNFLSPVGGSLKIACFIESLIPFGLSKGTARENFNFISL